MAAIDIGEARTLALKARDEAMRLGSKAWEKAPHNIGGAVDKAWSKAGPHLSRLLEEPKSFIAGFRPAPPQPTHMPARGTHWAYVAGVAALGFVAGAAAVGAGKAAARAIPPSADWLAALKAEHEKIEDLFDGLVETTDKQAARRKLMLLRLKRRLERRALAEESVLYPMLHEAGRTAEAKELSGQLFDIRSELHSLSESGYGDFGFIGKIEALRILVEAHLRRQEEVFADFQSGLSEQENAKLARAIAREGLRLS